MLPLYNVTIMYSKHWDISIGKVIDYIGCDF